MNKDKPSLKLSFQAIIDILVGIVRSGFWHNIPSRVSVPVRIPEDFFGINIATAEATKFDDYIVDRIKDLDIQCVRIDFSYDALDSYPARLIERAIAEGYDILLNVFPPIHEARVMDTDETAQQRWRNFIETVFATYHDKVALFEIGSTPNRKKWSGFNLPRYLPAWTIAHNVAGNYNIRLAGPNISDFEPPYNLAFLQAMARTGKTPEVHTNNLFVERVIEPEAYDHRVLGRWLMHLLSFNLIKKARVIDAIGKDFNCQQTYSTYKTWTIYRLQRWSDNPEQKQADYMVRYLVLAATSGALDRAYWGPLIDNRDGIIDDAAEGYPEVDNVTHYKCVRGKFESLRIRPSFLAYKHTISRLKGAECIQGISADNGVSHFVFAGKEKDLHICWCRDSYAIPLASLYPEMSDSAEFYNGQGSKLDYEPVCISEQPLFIEFPTSVSKVHSATQSVLQVPDLKKTNVRLPSIKGWQFVPYENEDWRGAIAFNNSVGFNDALSALLPEALEKAKIDRVLRDSRNLVWSINTGTHGMVTVKLNRVSTKRKIVYRFRDSKGRRHWNNASMMLRKGVNSPMPLAFFERHQQSGIQESYYVCAYLENTFSARDVFASINAGEKSFRNVDHDELLNIIAQFICHMHNHGILHRDLSSGNLLLTQADDGQVTPYLIDIGRARTGIRLTPRQRMIDLMRMHYKLTWPDREKLMNYYDQHLGRPAAEWWRYSVKYYEGKQKSKKAIKTAVRNFFKRS